MYQEVAFDPRCMAEYHYYGLLKHSFGFEAGRYVIAPVRDWAREAFQAAKASENLLPVRKKSITNFLNILQKSKDQGYVLLPKDRTDIKADNWSSWCTQQVVYLPFNSVVSELFLEAIRYDDVIEKHLKWALPPTVRIQKTAADISSSILTLLRFGGELLIVDQFFKLADNLVLKAIFSLVQEYQSITHIRLVTSINTANPQNVFNHEYISTYEYLPKFSLIVAPNKFFHDRYIISDKGAIKSGQGFSEGVEQGTQADKLSLSLCSIAESDETKQWIKTALEEGKATLLTLN